MLVTRSSIVAAGLVVLGAAALLAPQAAAQTCPTVSVAVDAPSAVNRGGSLVYKATITNHGVATVGDFALAINTPAMATLRKLPGPSKGATSRGTGPYSNVWQVPSLEPGKSKTLTLRLSVDKCAPEVLTIGAIGRKAGSSSCATPVPDAVVEVKGQNPCNLTPSLPPGFTSYQQIAALYNAPQADSVVQYKQAGIACTSKYALCAYAACRIVSTDTNPPLAECGCYGYTTPPAGPGATSLLSQNLLLSMQAQSQNSACVTNPTSCQTVNTAPICNSMNESPPNIYQRKFDLIAAYDPSTWPSATPPSNLPTNTFCTSGQFANCCAAGCFTQRSWNGFNTTCYCPVYNTRSNDGKLFNVGEGTCEGSQGFNVGSIIYSGMYFLNFNNI